MCYLSHYVNMFPFIYPGFANWTLEAVGEIKNIYRVFHHFSLGQNVIRSEATYKLSTFGAECTIHAQEEIPPFLHLLQSTILITETSRVPLDRSHLIEFGRGYDTSYSPSASFKSCKNLHFH